MSVILINYEKIDKAELNKIINEEKDKKIGVLFKNCDLSFEIIKKCDYVLISHFFDGFTRDIQQSDLFRFINKCDESQAMTIVQNIKEKNMLEIQQYLLKYGMERWSEENCFSTSWEDINKDMTNLGFKILSDEKYIDAEISGKIKKDLNINLEDYAYATNRIVIYKKRGIENELP